MNWLGLRVQKNFRVKHVQTGAPNGIRTLITTVFRRIRLLGTSEQLILLAPIVIFPDQRIYG
jgi:hypothetical protein